MVSTAFHHQVQIKLSQALRTQMESVSPLGQTGPPPLLCNGAQKALVGNGLEAPFPSVYPSMLSAPVRMQNGTFLGLAAK